MSLSQSIDFSPCYDKKNLLAFSAGVDSTALFFLLLQAGIDFDMAMVNYNTRENSLKELIYAQELAKEHKKKLFFLETELKSTQLEEKARKIRFDFFDSLIKEHSYENLLTAHQLNDQLEWFLMQLSKGAGVLELLGMERVQKREGYSLVRPLLKVSKAQLKEYLDGQEKAYFIDSSNFDENFKRNYFRHNFSDALIERYQEGITRSFDYIQEDSALLLQGSQVRRFKQLSIIKAKNNRSGLFYIDKDLKRRGYLLSHAQRQEIKVQKSLIISASFAIEQSGTLIFIAPVTAAAMDKKFKDACRRAEIPAKIRPYLYKEGVDLEKLKELITSLTVF